MEVLKQPQFTPVSVEKQVAIIYLASNNLIRKVPVNKVTQFEATFLMELENNHPQILSNFKAGKLIDADLEVVKNLALNLSEQFGK